MDTGNSRDGQDATPLLSDMENSSSSSSSKNFTVKVKCSDVGEIEMEVGVDETVDDFKQKLVTKMDISTEKRVRLIHQGKMLDPGTKRLSADFKITAGSFIHCVVSNPPNSIPLSPSDAAARSTATGSAAASSSSLMDMDGDEFNIQNDVAMAMNRSGSWRATPVAGMLIDDSRPLGTNRDFIWGVMMGYLLGGIMLFCVWDRNISHRQKTGILMGVTLQIITSIIQGQNVPDQRQSAQAQTQPAPGAVGTTGTALPAPVPGQVGDVYSGILLSSTGGPGTATSTAAALANITGVAVTNTTSLIAAVSPPTTAPTSLAAAVAAGAAAVYESMTATRL